MDALRVIWDVSKELIEQSAKYDIGKQLYEQQKYHLAEAAFRESAQGLLVELGKDDIDTFVSRYLQARLLNSKYWLAHTLYKQQKFAEAKLFFQESVQGREKVLGKDHVDTLDSKYWLARTFYKQQKYAEAEAPLRESAEGRERRLGMNHVDTFDSKDWLANTLYQQQKYAEAEVPFRESAQGRETVLGKDHVDTLDTKYWLVCTLYQQQKYVEAEALLRKTVQGREKVLGKDHINTLDSKYWLAVTLSKQKKYAKAEALFRESAQGREKVLAKDHVNTLDSKYELARTLSKQKKYAEAEGSFRESAQGRENVLGKDHVHTLNSKYWLALTLYRQQKYAEAEAPLRESAEGREKVCGKDHVDTLRSKRLLQELLLALAPAATTNNTSKTVVDRLGDFFTDGNNSHTPYTDSEIFEVSRLLKLSTPQWSKVPRTYIVLRTLGCLDLLDKFIDLGFSDHWFPVTERGLPNGLLRSSQRSEFVAAQSLVLTKSMDLEKGAAGQHCYFSQHEPLPLETKGILGSGGFGKVDKILSSISFKEYARKRVHRTTVFGGRRAEVIKQFIAEIDILKRLNHCHIVEFVGSYTDPKYMGLIMSPIAEMDLTAYLTRADDAKHGELRTFFGCLARALEFLHEQNVRHKDIKPSNILVDRGKVLFTDFGLSFDFSDADGSTSISMVNGMTPRYCAPEVAMHEPRNTASDIWSLGVVFLEMIVVLKGKTVEYMYDFFKGHGSQREYVRSNREALCDLVGELEREGVSDNRALGWVQEMLLMEPQLRPTATGLITSILAAGKHGEGNGAYCGICCVLRDDENEDEFSDTVDQLEDNDIPKDDGHSTGPAGGKVRKNTQSRS